VRNTDWYNPDHLVWAYEIEAAEAGMRVSDRVLKCAVYLGRKESGTFVPEGTGFVVRLTQGQVQFQYIVTAMHVLNGKPETIFVRVNKVGGGFDDLQVPRGWYYHEDHSRLVDIAAAPILLHPTMYDIIGVDLKDFCDDQFLLDRDVGVGDELFYPGMFMPHRGVGRNHPVMRFGALAAMPVEPVRTKSGPIKAYLMEGRSIGGHSGSPVFINFLVPRTYYADRVVRLPHPQQAQGYRLLGLIRGYLRAKDSGEYVTGEDPLEQDLWTNSGISTIIPAQEIYETLMQDELKDQRNVDEKKHMDGLADVPASTRLTDESSPTTDANPNHLKDFTRLVDVAARKRPQGGQT
jgi:hypothetical protein